MKEHVFEYIKEKIREKWTCCNSKEDCMYNNFRDSLIKDIEDWEEDYND